MLILDEDSRKYTTVNMQKGPFQHKRMPFGVASASAIFQRIIDSILVYITRVCCYLENILVTGGTEAAHLEAMRVVLGNPLDAGVKLKKERYIFGASSVTYLSHRTDAKGLHPLHDKVKAIVGTSVPKALQ